MECIVLLQAICSDEIITDEIHQINQMIYLDEISHINSFLNLFINFFDEIHGLNEVHVIGEI